MFQYHNIDSEDMNQRTKQKAEGIARTLIVLLGSSEGLMSL